LNKFDLETPLVVVDLDRLEENIQAMSERVRPVGAHLRPHIKTHKTPEVARMQVQHGANGITVAKLGEAEVMADAGFDDIFIANELIGAKKMRRLAELSKRVKVRSCVDSIVGAKMLSEAANEYGVAIDVLLDVNTGLDRTGIYPKQATELGREIERLPGVNLVGVFSYAGYKPAIPDEEARKAWAVREARIAVSVSEELQAAGIAATEVSVAGSSSAIYAMSVPGVTEVRPGQYVFNDAGMYRMGICSLSQCALKILTQVISRPASDRAVIDAGSKVLTTEKRIVSGQDPGYGLIEELPEAQVTALWEEHGVLHLDGDARRLAVGDTIEVIPNHVCPTINLTDVWYGIREGVVEQEFAVAARGKTS
jgi:D-serine deaminase-like pyridoxal phosphate-dependent protein